MRLEFFEVMAKKIHFIGICGVAMSALALAFKRQGWKVTGSDVGFYPPVSTHLKEAGIDFYPGWHPEKINKPDLVVVGNVASSTNPEWLYVQEHKLNYKSYPEVIAEYFVKKNSIVCAGTYGKTTSTALLTWILKEAGFDPNYMFGGLMATQGGETPPLPSAEMTDAPWSILEGDEYKTSKWDDGAKFFHYSPTHLLLTSVVWDHADVYPTEGSYFEAFRKLVAMVPEGGLRVISEKALSVILNEAKRSEESLSQSTNGQRSFAVAPVRGPDRSATSSHRVRACCARPSESRTRPSGRPLRASRWQDDNVVTYGKNGTDDYVYSNVTQLKNCISFDITHQGKTYPLTCPCLGEYMADNATGCFALAHQIGIAPEKIIAAIATFPGMKRRLEKRYEDKITIFDDIAHSPTKAKAVLESLRNVYSGKIFAVFEPNTGNRRPQARSWYSHCFNAADVVIIPKLTKIKIDPTDPDVPFEGDKLAEIISKTKPAVRYIEQDEELITYLKQKTQPGDVVVFLGSHGFRGMIEELIQQVSSKQ